MSLINKMLQDLEERQSATDALGSMQGYVRAAPEAPSRRRLWPIAVSLVASAAAVMAAGMWWMNSQVLKSRPTPITQPIAQAPKLSLKLDHFPSHPLTESPHQITAVAEPESTEGSRNSQTESGRSAKTDNVPSTQKIADAAPVLPDLASSPAAVAHVGKVLEKQADPAIPAVPVRTTSDSKRAQPDADTQKTRARATSIAQENFAPPGSANGMAEAEALPLKVSKQVKALTPAQRAENEYRHALGLIEQGRNKEAISVLETTLQFDAGHGAARQTLAALLLEDKRPEEAMRKLSEGLAMDKAQVGLAMMLARLQVDRQEARMAIDTLQRSLPHATERADYRAFLAALLQREARHKEAIDHYAAALRKTPNNGIWWMGAGISLQAENRIPEARDAYSRAKMSGTLSPELLAFVEQKLAQLR